jgi:hypothetical protein
LLCDVAQDHGLVAQARARRRQQAPQVRPLHCPACRAGMDGIKKLTSVEQEVGTPTSSTSASYSPNTGRARQAASVRFLVGRVPVSCGKSALPRLRHDLAALDVWSRSLEGVQLPRL